MMKPSGKTLQLVSDPRTPGWIYVLASSSHPGIVKIGRTSKHTPGRMVEVDRSDRQDRRRDKL